MRNIKQLLELTLERVVEEDIRDTLTGLCSCITDLHLYWTITGDEYDLLRKYVWYNKPKHASSSYWWPKGRLEPRVKWLKAHIENPFDGKS